MVVKKSFAPKAGAKKAGSANNDADETPRPPISAGRAVVEVHVTHFEKPVAYGSAILFPEIWMNMDVLVDVMVF